MSDLSWRYDSRNFISFNKRKKHFIFWRKDHERDLEIRGDGGCGVPRTACGAGSGAGINDREHSRNGDRSRGRRDAWSHRAGALGLAGFRTVGGHFQWQRRVPVPVASGRNLCPRSEHARFPVRAPGERQGQPGTGSGCRPSTGQRDHQRGDRRGRGCGPGVDGGQQRRIQSR